MGPRQNQQTIQYQKVGACAIGAGPIRLSGKRGPGGPAVGRCRTQRQGGADRRPRDRTAPDRAALDPATRFADICGCHAFPGVRMIGIPVALVFENIGEWAIHKYVLHGMGRRKGNFFAFHWEHHRAAHQNGFRDPGYERSAFHWNAQGKEAFALVAVGAAYTPLLPIFPFFTLTLWWRMLGYWKVHRHAHIDPEWAREHLPWHWNHHMGPNPNRNWCVTHPWFDRVMGTLDPFPLG